MYHVELLYDIKGAVIHHNIVSNTASQCVVLGIIETVTMVQSIDTMTATVAGQFIYI